MLTSLYKQGAIWLDSQQGQWIWDLGAVRTASATANVVELMVQRLASFPEATRAALTLAAYFGNTFSLGAVAGLLGSDAVSVAQALSEPIREGLIFATTGDFRFLELATEATASRSLDAQFRFQHDRVQEAAYSLTRLEERAGVHVRIGRALLAQSGPEPSAEQLFVISASGSAVA